MRIYFAWQLWKKECQISEILCRKCCLYGKGNGECMILYHGSNIEVMKPRLLETKRFLDFGPGFYLTSDFEQAKKWAIRTVSNRGEGSPMVSVFDIDEDTLQGLSILSFDSANREWLRYISANRTGRTPEPYYDVIIGPVANDQTIRTINNYLRGYFSEEIAIQLLLPQKLKDQYTFKSERALELLRFMEVK